MPTRPPGAFIAPHLHPAALFRNATLTHASIEDWKKSARIQREGRTIVPPPLEPWQWLPKLYHVERYFGEMGDSDPGPWANDFEATLDYHPVCNGFWSCHDTLNRRGICIPKLQQGGSEYWTHSEWDVVFRLQREFYENPKLGKVGQNYVGYDCGYPPFHTQSLIWLAWKIRVVGIVGDTLAAHHVLYAELKHSLSFQASTCTDMSPFKQEVHQAYQSDLSAEELEASGGRLDEEDEDFDEDRGASFYARILDRPDKQTRVYNLDDCFSTAIIWPKLERAMA